MTPSRGDRNRCSGDPFGTLCDASHSTNYVVFALQVALAIAVIYALIVGALLVTPA